MEYNYSKDIIFPDPPTKYKVGNKTYYFTTNLYYGQVHWSVRYKAVNFAKDFMLLYIDKMPELSNLKIKLTYSRTTDNFDLDNKLGFWVKVFLDLLKKPSKKELANNKYAIKSINVVHDDSCKYIDEIRFKYEKGKHFLKVEIKGILKENEEIVV